MKNIGFLFLIFLIVTNCKSASSLNMVESDTVVKIDTLFQDKISIRAIVCENSKVWYAADANRFGYFDLIENKRNEIKIVSDSLALEFRSIAQNQENIFVLSVANPALLYKISKKDLTYQLVYKETHENVFYDSMQFWDSENGIAVGDPIEGVISIILTHDGGQSWQKVAQNLAPKLFEGEAFFAASNSNIVIKKNKTWLVTGGKKARIFLSDNFGKSWSDYPTPIIQGKTMTGIFSGDFYDAKTGMIVGGDYEIPNQNSGNKAITNDGGKTWQLVAENRAFGYASCVQYVPNSKGKKIIVVGALGIHYSLDGGQSWLKLSDDSQLYTIRFMNEKTAIAAGRNKLIRIKFN
ncbi:WD40/YVTN/BNR-like repeat-containing protein [Flavobacterium agrisoli]|uniref:Oxidoreductase n=1 Tax=Flavobacterium agrisoli TaxID=2793066 RepID=A0A934PL57_9FLAO|nr:oxidoreductase [Flavobacterium agrisoli]MBK0368948.1 oxidoreductase [Flavobacterium agrisoli]